MTGNFFMHLRASFNLHNCCDRERQKFFETFSEVSFLCALTLKKIILSDFVADGSVLVFYFSHVAFGFQSFKL